MSGLDIFVTKSYDKTLVKQRGKKMADKKLGITKDMQRYAAVSKKPKPKETVLRLPKGMTLEEHRKKSMKKPDAKVRPMRVTLAANKSRSFSAKRGK